MWMKNKFLFVICMFFLFLFSWIGTAEPFWKAKTEVFNRIKEERAIIVSAKAESEGDLKVLKLTTAGMIHAPASFSDKLLTDYNSYTEFLPYIKESSFDKTTNNLFLHGALLGFHVRMTIHIKAEAEGSGHRFSWESIAGGFIGMHGVVLEEDFDSEHTLVSMEAEYKGESLGIPTFILNRGLEFAGQRASGAMRSHVESRWEDSKKGVK